jgi:zinc/manganese transport system substrate-binding protein
VVATTSILADVTANLAPNHGSVETLIPSGVDPHDFVASSQQGASLASADLVIANGLGLEHGLVDLLAQTEADGVTVLRVGELVDPLPANPEISHEEEDDGAFDPHFWQDPLRMATAIDHITSALRAAGVEATAAEDYKQRLRDVDSEIVSIVSAIPAERRVLITNHDAFSYFAARYGFTIIGTVIPATDTGAEPSSRDLADLVRLIDEYDVPAIFVESIASPELALSLAEEAERPVRVVLLVSDALGEPGSDTETYAEMLLFNANAIADALEP